MQILKIKNPYLRIASGIFLFTAICVVTQWLVPQNIRLFFLIFGFINIATPFLRLLASGNLFNYGDFHVLLDPKNIWTKYIYGILVLLFLMFLLIPII
ncbi:hypothetical protein NT95_01355 [Oenococcus kitaharae]|nr:hypothetical protein NT95_01355 [Oenococcus kitaharae]OEY85026.1 hypothetical protein NT96_02925 [Oenococcus kitaharae]OEY85817.1 hypothetical protein NV75_03230 [Oenococcus kitaharae]